MADDSRSPEKRFSDRVDNYVRYRPSYPIEIIDILQHEAGLKPESVVADIGAGTGIFSELLLQHGYKVTGVEPNDGMRNAAARLLAPYPQFTSVKGTAETTTLAGTSVDLIVAAQAFHWFKAGPTRHEFSRILKPQGKIALIWNVRRVDSTPFLRAYENLLLKHATDYSQVRHENIGTDELRGFFEGGSYITCKVPNGQSFDLEGLSGRLLSSSYAPAKGQRGHEAMMTDLTDIFERHQSDGQVRFEYDTEIYIGS